ncbi:MAG TPA: tetratricopeptide repeat protein [Trinickia sp.]|uniref:TPR end-of-group domain-containing protein n=1 Tax=Trinickia sp. TaxID=2571163 RepID=UPI002C9265F3|nr:tetratricopeptide repeat protein [Trinickia sp.]HVW50251.1 tetratricopeptide repeat protein [Trinickia sp.]
MPKYKCPSVGDCDKANTGEIFERTAAEDIRCPECSTLMVLQDQNRTSKPANPKIIAIAAVAIFVVVAALGGGLYYKKSHATVATETAAAATATTASAPAPATSVTPIAKTEPASAPVTGNASGIAPSDAEITAQRKDSDTKLKQGDAQGAESESNQVAAKEMVKAAIAQMSQGKLAEAEKELNDALARDPRQSLVYYNMGVLRLKQGRTDEALKQFEASFLNGFNYFDEMAKDPDLNSIRNDPRFIVLVKKYRTTV